MADWIRIPTSAEVAAVIRARHGKELIVFGSFSDPDGRFNGGPGEQGRMETTWGFVNTDAPILEARTTWDIDPEHEHKRVNERHEYWLCIANNNEDRTMDHIKTIVPTGTEAGFDLAKQTFDERFARDSHFGWKPLDYWSAGYDAALARRAAPLAHPIEQGSAVEPIGEVVRVSKSEGQVVIGLYGKSPKIGSLVYLSAPSSTDSAQAAVEEVQTQAARDVLAERRRQVEQEGWTSAHDDKYQKEELRAAALCYMRCKDITKPGVTPGAWPWSERWWKPTTDRRNLVKAAALIIADIERIDRSTAAQAATKGGKS